MSQPSISHLSVEQQEQLRSIAHWAKRMDGSWSIFGVPVGWDAIIGLLPIAGDMVTSCVSLSLVYKAKKMGAPKRLLFRMLINVLVDFFAGSVPLLGDLFDLMWHANAKNLALLERYYGQAGESTAPAAHKYIMYVALGGMLIGGALAASAYFSGQ